MGLNNRIVVDQFGVHPDMKSNFCSEYELLLRSQQLLIAKSCDQGVGGGGRRDLSKSEKEHELINLVFISDCFFFFISKPTEVPVMLFVHGGYWQECRYSAVWPVNAAHTPHTIHHVIHFIKSHSL